MKLQTYKIQTDATGTALLIYNQSRSVFWQGGIFPEIAQVMGPLEKRYVEGYIDADGILNINSWWPEGWEESW